MKKSKYKQLQEEHEKNNPEEYISEDLLAKVHFEGEKIRKALNLESDGFFNEAIEIYQEVIENAVMPSIAHRKLWQYYRKKKMYKEEIEVIERYLELLMGDEFIQYINQGKIQRAEKRLQVAKRLLAKGNPG